MSDVPGLVDHLFRREAGRLVAALTRALGPEHLDLAEDVVHEAMLAALRTWPVRGLPDDPVAWLARAARNRALDQVRHRAMTERTAEAVARRLAPRDDPAADDGPPDDVLRMLFMGCHPALPREGRLALTLKAVAGLGVGEIARAFLLTPDAVAQRLVRTKRLVRELGLAFELPPAAELPARLDAVLEVLYALFNEGHVAHAGEDLVRPDLCDDALRLAGLLTALPATDRPEVHAALALMHLVRARQPARTGPAGELVPLAEQDRARWDRNHLARGLRHLARSAAGDVLTRYHLEAEIAACHATAPSDAATDWPRVLDRYDALLALAPSPVVALNRAVALSRVRGPAAAIAEVERLRADPALARYHLLPATLGALWDQAGRPDRAAPLYDEALALPCTAPERRLLEARLAASGG
ncbi:MAG: RNA polymerase subunit sigma [Planctomycetes bacterium]|nr:RNA polymerase subunit sigma [Planctomycetota bacterium]